MDPSTRLRCAQCGNLTRFDVVETRRTRAFHHYALSGELTVEDEEVLGVQRELVTCRWCGSTEVEDVAVEPGAAGTPPERGG